MQRFKVVSAITFSGAIVACSGPAGRSAGSTLSADAGANSSTPSADGRVSSSTSKADGGANTSTSSADGGDDSSSTSGADGGDGGDGGDTSSNSLSSDRSGGNGNPNCAGLPSTCGSAGNEGCCTTMLVQGGTFSRSYDAVTYTDPTFPATVSNFKLDRFLVTVGRMRSFVTAVEEGWLPAVGAGKHEHLNGGGGLNGGTEAGWNPAWSSNLARNRMAWDSHLLCDATHQTWTSSPGANEQRPINCLEWGEAFAFGIWDGGFLPSETEENYAQSGGSEQRVYPWSTPPTSTTIDCSYANYNPGPACSSPLGLNDVGSESPKGDGKWGQADLVGNVWEWTLDYFALPYALAQCTDCADLTTGGIRAIRGGTFYDDASYMAASYRHTYSQSGHSPLFGVRCARTP